MPNPPKLPDLRRIDRSKIDEYLLHPINGRGKAAFFEAYGFSLLRWEALRDALLDHALTGLVQEVVVSPYGSRYAVRGGLCAHPAGASSCRWSARSGRPTMAPKAFG